MFLAHVGCVFMGLILYITGVQGQSKHICAFEGSTVNLPCVTENPNASMRWYTVNWTEYTGITQNEISTDGNHITLRISKNSQPTLVIKDVRSRDNSDYCCTQTGESPQRCWTNRIQLHVADLQVKVIPATKRQTVTLICSTSCPQTENPAAYIWYKNREFLYEDWSPWFQQLVSSDQKVTYSCAVKGQEDSRAPEVSVDSITPSCFSVTYTGGKMCSHEQSSAGMRCSITYPRELYIRKNLTHDEPKLTCHTSCPLTESQMDYLWYRNGHLQPHITSQSIFIKRVSEKGFACAIKGNEDLLSAEFCSDELKCWRVNYFQRRICALQGSSLYISSKYLLPFKKQPSHKIWYKKKSGEEDAEELTEVAGRVKFLDNSNLNQHILEITNLQKSDSAEYKFRPQQDEQGWSQTHSPGVTVIVSDLRVKCTPSALVTEGQKVTLTCSTSCPLTDDTNYVWYLNREPLTLPEYQGKVLVLHSVSMQHAGNYSCAVTALRDIRSHEETLTVHRGTGGLTSAAAGVAAVPLVVILLIAVLWLRKRRSSSQSPQNETSLNMEQQNPSPVNEDISAQPAEQDDLLYSTAHTSENHEDLNLIQPHHQQEQEEVQYTEVFFQPKQDS